MSPDEQRVTIATQMGWEHIYYGPDKRYPEDMRSYQDQQNEWRGMAPGHSTSEDDFPLILPDYPGSLDAMVEAVSALSEDHKHAYAVVLAGLLWAPEMTRGWTDWRDTLAVSEASCKIRAKALLCAIGKWKEDAQP